MKDLGRLFGLLALLHFPAGTGWAQIGPLQIDRGANGLALALRRLPVTARVLYVTAHPDDENNAVLVMLSRGRGLRTGLLTLTRGDGGQNALGPELFSALGILRTGELEACHRYDGVEQYFSAAYEFGFSFSREDTVRRWGHDETLGDVVRVIRTFRPDVILTLPLEAPDHQHHTAAAHFALEGFRAAADPNRYPEQGLRPWKTQKIYEGGVGGGGAVPAGAVLLSTDTYDPLLGKTWAEYGWLSRSSHKSQGAARIDSRETPPFPYHLVEADPRPSEPESDVLDGVPTSLPALVRFVTGPEATTAGGELSALAAEVKRAADLFDARDPSRTLPALTEGLARLRGLEEKVKGVPEILDRLKTEEANFLRALPLAQGLGLEATSSVGDLAPGGETSVTVRVSNHGTGPISVESLSLHAPQGWRIEGQSVGPVVLAPGKGVANRIRVTASTDAKPTQPYWRHVESRDRDEVLVPSSATLPWDPPALVASLRYTVSGVTAVEETPVLFHYLASALAGERVKNVNVVPALSLSVSPARVVLPSLGSRKIDVQVRARGQEGARASVKLEIPPGWVVQPPSAPVAFGRAGEEIAIRFEVQAPKGPTEGLFPLEAVGTLDGREFRTGYQTIAYDHVEARHLYSPARADVRLLDVRVRDGVRVGYVMGVGDEVPEALRQIGVPLHMLSEDDLALSDLSRYTTIVLGIRAYQARRDLQSYNGRLLEYVERGGNLVVQYNRAEFNAGRDGSSPFTPYPARVTANRITDPRASLTALIPESPIFHTPNELNARDWEGWVQERGIQFLEAKDPRYQDLLSGHDSYPLNSGEKKGILVVARVGKGTWTYVGLGLFRQVAAETPGVYRILANLVSRPY